MSSRNPERRRRLTVPKRLCTGNSLPPDGVEKVMVSRDFTIREATGADIPELRPSSYRSSPLFVLPEYEGHGTELAWLAVSPDTRAARFYMRRNWTQPAQIPAARSASSHAAPRSPTPRISRPDAARSRMRRMGMVDDSESCGPGESYHRQSKFQCAGVC
jgi:hypothetical protein